MPTISTVDVSSRTPLSVVPVPRLRFESEGGGCSTRAGEERAHMRTVPSERCLNRCSANAPPSAGQLGDQDKILAATARLVAFVSPGIVHTRTGRPASEYASIRIRVSMRLPCVTFGFAGRCLAGDTPSMPLLRRHSHVLVNPLALLPVRMYIENQYCLAYDLNHQSIGTLCHPFRT